ncbi:cytochrome P450 4F3-like [Aplysia californica]|uniref:Cytochrome P450 4F3-like n=1 Tax=Aplysia californica TaxID=6500 RepID=A0ABM1W3P7_APLCA|nr:cytochrome P450 4F3-like [Aplysia californica]
MLTLYVLVAVTCVLVVKYLRHFLEHRRTYSQLPGDNDLHWLLGNLHKFPGLREEGREFDYENARTYKYFHRVWFPGLREEGREFDYENARTYKYFHRVWESLRLSFLAASKPRRLGLLASSYDMGVRWLGEGLILTNGARWSRNRRLLTPAFHFDILKNYVKTYHDFAILLQENMLKAAKEGKSFDLQPLVNKYTLDVILRCAFSYNSNCQVEDSEYTTAISELQNRWAHRTLKPLLYLESIYLLTSEGRRFYQLCDVAHRQAERVIASRQREMGGEVLFNARKLCGSKKDGYPPSCPSFHLFLTTRPPPIKLLSIIPLSYHHPPISLSPPSHHPRLSPFYHHPLTTLSPFFQAANPAATSTRKARDFLDTLLTARDEEGKGLTPLEIRDEVDTFMFAGHDTTASGIMWTLISLSQHPDYQDQVYREVKAVLGDRKELHWEDLGKLQFTGQCIKEALRLHSAVPIIERVSTEDVWLNHHRIPAGIRGEGRFQLRADPDRPATHEISVTMKAAEGAYICATPRLQQDTLSLPQDTLRLPKDVSTTPQLPKDVCTTPRLRLRQRETSLTSA